MVVIELQSVLLTFVSLEQKLINYGPQPNLALHLLLTGGGK